MTYTQNLKHSELKKIVLIGASTGGPGQIEKVINFIPVLTNTSIIIAQHMVDGFLESFTKRLQEHNNNPVSLIHDNDTLVSGTIYVSYGDTSAYKSGSGIVFSQNPPTQHSFNPDINILFNSFVPFAKEIKILSIILTGIGEDGVDGCNNLSLHGSICITESKESAIVDGMPNRAREIVKDIGIYDINTIADIVKEFCE
jgi:two-component system, chemotaxis family, protein-glutamate methylesterase/glutaminase